MKMLRVLGIVLVLGRRAAGEPGGGSGPGHRRRRPDDRQPRSGRQAVRGEAQLAADEVNAKGGIKGKKVVIRVEDNKGDPKEAATVAEKFASDDKVLAVVGHYTSSACFAAIPIYTRARLATISPSASHTSSPSRAASTCSACGRRSPSTSPISPSTR